MGRTSHLIVIGAIPTFFAGPLVGYISDKIGSEWLAAPILVSLVPLTLLFMLKHSLPGFVVIFTCISEWLFKPFERSRHVRPDS